MYEQAKLILRAAELADLAFSQYDFGAGVTVDDSVGWVHTKIGFECTRKVYVVTAAQDDTPAYKSILTFTVRFDSNGSMTEAFAADLGEKIWGKLRTSSDAPDSAIGRVQHPAIDPLSLMQFRIERLQESVDHKRVDEAVRNWLKSFAVVAPDDAVPALVSCLGSIVSRSRSGDGRPTLDEVKASIESSNEHVVKHNAMPGISIKLEQIDLAGFPDAVLTEIIAGDQLDPAAYLSAMCGDAWGECEEFPRSVWRHEASEGSTQLGYWVWVVHQAEERKIHLHLLTLTQTPV